MKKTKVRLFLERRQKTKTFDPKKGEVLPLLVLSIHVQFFRECSACAYKLWAYAQQTLTIHVRMLSMRVHLVCVC